MNKVLVIGHSPSRGRRTTQKQNNPTLKRLNRWLDACNVGIYSFTNLCASSATSLKKGEICETMLHEIFKDYNKIITLGKEVKHYTNKMGYDFYELPHPSPLNRNLNDKEYEKDVIKGLQSFIHSV
tara:strand:+ start:242 stop:619 length:378 start_codon:yes stop_codon:yes gene_type:complete